MVNVLLMMGMFLTWYIAKCLRMDDEAFWYAAKINLVLLVFNLMPAWPLDGGRLLFPLIRRWVSTPYAQIICGTCGVFLAIIAMILSPAIFLFVAALIAANLTLALTGVPEMMVEKRNASIEEKAAIAGSWRTRYQILVERRGGSGSDK